jgi:hypothetical protein
LEVSEMASGIYNVFKGKLMTKALNLGTGGDTIKVALYDGSHAFTATDTVYTATNELADAVGGYTRDSKTLTGQSVTTGATTKWDADDVAWTSATFTAYHAVVYDSTDTKSLICSIDFGGAKTVAAGTFTISWDAAGIITLA